MGIFTRKERVTAASDLKAGDKVSLNGDVFAKRDRNKARVVETYIAHYGDGTDHEIAQVEYKQDGRRLKANVPLDSETVTITRKVS